MRLWTKLLPLFFIEWYAWKHLERFQLQDVTVVQPYAGTIFERKDINPSQIS